MKKFYAMILVAAFAAYAYAGSSGVSNPVGERTPAERLKEKVIEFNDDVVTELDVLHTGYTAGLTKSYTNYTVSAGATTGAFSVVTNVYTITSGKITALTTNGVSI